jgi:hypothetical protein
VSHLPSRGSYLLVTSKGILCTLWGCFWNIKILANGPLPGSPSVFSLFPFQKWSRATRDYKKFVHKKPSFHMARKGRSEVHNMIFSHQLPLQLWSERKYILKMQGEHSNTPLLGQYGTEFVYLRLPRSPKINHKSWWAYAGAVESTPSLLSHVWLQPMHPELTDWAPFRECAQWQW